VVVKAGKLSSAFGAFPLHYDDADNPLLDQPLPYAAYLKLRADQLPCGVADLLGQQYASSVNYACGGSSGDSEGLVPVTLYGLPGVELDLSTHKIDARIQLTNSSGKSSESAVSKPACSVDGGRRILCGTGISRRPLGLSRPVSGS
jgi:hypothetical protein